MPATHAPVLKAARGVAEEPLVEVANDIDRFFQAMLARQTGGLSPSSLAQALADWAVHSAFQPSRSYVLGAKAVRKGLSFAELAVRTAADGDAAAPAIAPLPGDRRFADPAWQQPPYNLMAQGFLLGQQWWHNAVTGVAGVSPDHERVMDFVTRQWLDIWAPSNWPVTNPVVRARTLERGGANLWRGAGHAWLDMLRQAATGTAAAPADAAAYRPGDAVAVTPGRVVYRNRLIELIQYCPTTPAVHAEPILIMPAWIMKYYILDLEPANSLVRQLVDAGFTVFMISWHNPNSADADLSLEDYRQLGFAAALDAVTAITGAARTHVAGYCLGGTLATIGAATMARDGDARLASLTLLAAQTDFTEPGELALFISPAQVEFLEAIMWAKGYLDGSRMGGAFQLLRSNDLVWSRLVQAYLLGEDEHLTALMAWNADGTRMPATMHSEYLRRLYLNNALVGGHYLVGDRPIVIGDISAPIFAVGTERDHVAPWQSVYKINLFAQSAVTFLLASGGHNAGIVAAPGGGRQHYRINTHHPHLPYVDPLSWQAVTDEQPGSWWPAWTAWLAGHGDTMVPPPPLGRADMSGAVDAAAPGIYVFE